MQQQIQPSMQSATPRKQMLSNLFSDRLQNITIICSYPSISAPSTTSDFSQKTSMLVSPQDCFHLYKPWSSPPDPNTLLRNTLRRITSNANFVLTLLLLQSMDKAKERIVYLGSTAAFIDWGPNSRSFDKDLKKDFID